MLRCNFARTNRSSGYCEPDQIPAQPATPLSISRPTFNVISIRTNGPPKTSETIKFRSRSRSPLPATADPTIYDAQFFLGSSRPVYKSQKNSAMLRLFDDSWEFRYVKNQPLVHDELKFDALTSFINFYMYLVLGYDFDSYAPPLSGTPYFQKAISFCGQAGSTKGWDRANPPTYSKYSFVLELLDSKFESIREGMFIVQLTGESTIWRSNRTPHTRTLSHSFTPFKTSKALRTQALSSLKLFSMRSTRNLQKFSEIIKTKVCSSFFLLSTPATREIIWA